METIINTLRDSKAARWTALAVVAFTMLCGYYLTDVMAPLKPMLEKELLWNSTDYGFFTSAYGWFNVFLLIWAAKCYDSKPFREQSCHKVTAQKSCCSGKGYCWFIHYFQIFWYKDEDTFFSATKALRHKVSQSKG